MYLGKKENQTFKVKTQYMYTMQVRRKVIKFKESMVLKVPSKRFKILINFRLSKTKCE